jgi:hypothetical protein
VGNELGHLSGFQYGVIYVVCELVDFRVVSGDSADHAYELA